MRFFRVLILFFIVSGCTDITNLVEDAPKQDYCNIFLKEELSPNPFYLSCYNEPEDIFYNVEGVDAQNYVAVSITSIIELISWVRRAEAVLNNGMNRVREVQTIHQAYPNLHQASFNRSKVEIDVNEARKYLRQLRLYRRSLEKRLEKIKKVK